MLREVKAYIVEFYYSILERFVGTNNDLDIKAQFSQADNGYDVIQKKINTITSLLRATPWWANGHLRLGQLALHVKDLELAKGSFEAVRKLRPNTNLELGANLGLAKYCVASGAYDQAIEIIAMLPQSWRENPTVKEQLVACHLAKENYEEAKRIADEIPQEMRSAELLAAIDFLKSKTATPA